MSKVCIMSLNGKSMMSLKEFFLRKQVLKLYKDILLCIREVPSKEDQKELREWVRRDFKANKYHKDQINFNSSFVQLYLSVSTNAVSHIHIHTNPWEWESR